MKVVSTQFISLDGVYQGPGAADEDVSGGFDRGGWMAPFIDEGFVRDAASWLTRADALLLGRRTYEAFSAAWPSVPRHDPLSAMMNDLPKFVVASTTIDTSWGHTTVLADNPLDRIAELRDAEGGELQVHGSGSLARSLILAGLVDELRLVISPVIVGAGRRMFLDHADPVALRFVGQHLTAGGLSILCLERASMPTFGEYRGIDSLERHG